MQFRCSESLFNAINDGENASTNALNLNSRQVVKRVFQFKIAMINDKPTMVEQWLDHVCRFDVQGILFNAINNSDNPNEISQLQTQAI